MKQSYGDSGLYSFLAILATVVVTILVAQGSSGAVLWFTLFWLVLFALTFVAFDSPQDRVRIASFIRRRNEAIAYAVVSRWILRHLARIIAPTTAQKQPLPDKGLLKILHWHLQPRAVDIVDLNRLRANPWSWPTIDVAIKLALIYPLYIFLAQWGVIGSEMRLGSAVLLPSEPRTLVRLLIIAGLAYYLVSSMYIAVRHSGDSENPRILVYTNKLAFSGVAAFALASAGVDVGGAADINALACAVSGAIAFLFAGAIAGAIAVAVAFAFSFGGGGLTESTLVILVALILGTVIGGKRTGVAIAVGIAGLGSIVALFFIYAYGSGSAVQGATIGAVAASAVSIVGVVASATCQMRKGYWSYAGTWLWSFGVLLSVFAFQTAEISSDFRVFAFALGILPLLNALFDYLSYGVTISLIKIGAAQRNLWSFVLALIDMIIAYALLVSLGTAALLTLALINSLGGQTFVSIGGLLADLRDNSTQAEYAWLCLSLLSTLIPTCVHLSVGILSTSTWFPIKAKVWLSHRLLHENTSSLDKILVSALSSLAAAVWCFMIAVFVTKGVVWIWGNLDTLGMMLLSHVEHVFQHFVET